MKKKDRTWNSLLIVATIGFIGFAFAQWPLHGFLDKVTERIRAGDNWLHLAVLCAYTLGWFVTRTVEDTFDAIFDKPPFSETGSDAPEGHPKHSPTIDFLLGILAYILFYGRLALIMGILVAFVWLIVRFTISA